MSDVDRLDGVSLALLRGRMHEAIDRLNLATSATVLMHRLVGYMDENGGFWRGAKSIGEQMERSTRWIRELLARLRLDELVIRIERGGGRHRTSVYLLNVGPVAIFRNHRHHANRVKTTLRRRQDWLDGLFLAHAGDAQARGEQADCSRWAPRRLRKLLAEAPP